MRVAIFDKPHHLLRIETREVPRPGRGQVVVKVRRCGMCGSDIHWTEEHARTVPSGTVMGHEFSGEITAIGAKVADLSVGDRVCAMPFTGCGECASCGSGHPFWCSQKRSMWGGYGQYTVVAASSCARLPPQLTWEDGALVEPLSSGLHAIRLAQVSEGSRALVIGAGPIGLSCVYWLRRANAKTITVTARTPRRKELALSMGATEFFPSGGNALEGAANALKTPPDVVFECTGAPGMMQRAMEIVRPRGTVIIAGMCMQPDPIAPALGILKELRLLFVGAYGMDEFKTTVDALACGDVSPRKMITRILSLDELPTAFEEMRHGTDHCKMMVDPWR